jgi:hypothetical protein
VVAVGAARELADVAEKFLEEHQGLVEVIQRVIDTVPKNLLQALSAGTINGNIHIILLP